MFRVQLSRHLIIHSLIHSFIHSLYQKRIQRRDVQCLEYDKYKTKVIKYSAKPPKEQNKVVEAEKKFEEHKEQYKVANAEVLADLRRFIGNRLVDFHREYLQVEKERM
jgi:hypothetical protein